MELLLGVIAFTTSLIAAIVGFGGGMLLIALLPLFLNPVLVIPIHGLTQITSNASRALFSLSDVKWSLLPAFLVGSILGTVLFGMILYTMPTTYIPLAIGLYILLNLWYSPFSNFIKRFENFYIIGALQTGLGLIVGATGPLSLTVLTKQLQSKDQVVATSAVFMTFSHLAKIPVFLLVSSELLESGYLIIAMICGAILGSYTGTKVRFSMDNNKLIGVIKLLLSILAINMMISVIIQSH
ncbi:sulfite exporter TauE/SafE family protein [Pseudoalteromonas luteoviolacea]|uniref:Probable membrane transporter protein n=1 Tax=Pseudoalteromonas luteoviolacea S4054 TaxID=1129367 RepID=A0A0F6AF80_9GAMM|nr:sulfite exporter TauE/SafE family protein [Pseudoalteromonas luteoviolacea]KKE84818.1 hypothetical protein N479_07735 [Pseudoalteromonas luteoviolacea S4054]KZN72841.1 hypothetical protein N481_14540 [Pseudoalteromonas luteoviolacea S4047-1]